MPRMNRGASPWEVVSLFLKLLWTMNQSIYVIFWIIRSRLELSDQLDSDF